MYKVGVIGCIGEGLGRENFVKAMADNGMEAIMFDPGLKKLDSVMDFEGVAVNEIPINDDFLDHVPNLRVIVKCGVGLDSVNFEATGKRGIKVQNMPGVNKESVAECALGLMISVGRGMISSDLNVREGNWTTEIGSSIIGKTLGVVGTGNIGTTLAKYVKAFNMKVIGYDVMENDGFKEAGGTYVSFEELLKESDFISLHVPLIDATRDLFSYKQFETMKNTAVIVDCARGGIINEEALYDAVTTGKIRGAGIDVFVQEPVNPDNPLLTCKNIMLTTHMGGRSDYALANADKTCVKIMRELLDETKQ